MTFSLLSSLLQLSSCVLHALVNAQSSGSTESIGRTIGIVVGSASGILIVGICLPFMVCLLGICCECTRSEGQSMPPRDQLSSRTYIHRLQPRTEPSYSSSGPTNTTTGVPHSIVPLESELQNVPPPDYSTAHQYPAYTQPDEATSQIKNSEEPTEEPPPPYPSPS